MRFTATIFSKPSTPVRLALNTSAMPADRDPVERAGTARSGRRARTAPAGRRPRAAAPRARRLRVADPLLDRALGDGREVEPAGRAGCVASVIDSLALVFRRAPGAGAPRRRRTTGAAGRNIDSASRRRAELGEGRLHLVGDGRRRLRGSCGESGRARPGRSPARGSGPSGRAARAGLGGRQDGVHEIAEQVSRRHERVVRRGTGARGTLRVLLPCHGRAHRLAPGPPARQDKAEQAP